MKTTGKPEDFSAGGRESEYEMGEGEGEEGDKMEFGQNEFDGNLPATAEEEAQFESFLEAEDEMFETFEGGEMDEMDDESKKRSSDALRSESSELGGKKRAVKVKSEESIYSLPVQKLCAVVKLKNEFNFFERSSLTKNILARVRVLSK